MTNNNLANAIVCVGYTALSAIALSLTVPAVAQETRQERVAYSDLDLTSEAGQATLAKRIHAAVKRVCRSDGTSVTDALDRNRCKRASLANANLRMDVAIAKARGSNTAIAALTVGRSAAEKR